jgi:2-polyprenyl-3-methyl-5-hydroxy-6-metoxy-1,4-benzoquinol methylase
VTTRELVAVVSEFGRDNSVQSLVDAAPYLDALAEAFGDRDAREVTARELHAFHRGAGAGLAGPVLDALARKSERWEAIYAFRAHGALESLPWESERPVRPLVDLFDRDGFEPRNVLELGCGDGVNAVFMASRGCRVTAVDISPSALAIAGRRSEAAGVEVDFVEADVLALGPAPEPYDLVFDRGMFHHVQVFHFEDYRDMVAERLAADGVLHLICHHVSDRQTLIADALCGSVGKLLSFLSGALVEAGAGFTEPELREVFSDRFRFESVNLVGDDHNRPFRFLSAVMRRSA